MATTLVLDAMRLLPALITKPSNPTNQSPDPVASGYTVGRSVDRLVSAVTQTSLLGSYAEGSGWSQCKTPAALPAPATGVEDEVALPREVVRGVLSIIPNVKFAAVGFRMKNCPMIESSKLAEKPDEFPAEPRFVPIPIRPERPLPIRVLESCSTEESSC